MRIAILIFVFLFQVVISAQNNDAKIFYSKWGKSYPSTYKKAINDKVGEISPSEEMGDQELITNQKFESLSTYEKFLFCVVYPEAFYQNCAVPMDINGTIYQLPEASSKKLVARLPSDENENNLSERQRAFLDNERNAVLGFIKTESDKSGFMGNRFKSLVVEMNATELIPWMIEHFNKFTKKEDGYILTTLFLLLEKNNYKEFMSSLSYNCLYGEQSLSKGYIPFNSANIDLTCKRAMGLYNLKHK